MHKRENIRKKLSDWSNTHQHCVAELAEALVAIKSPNPPGDVREMADAIETIAASIPGVEFSRHISEEHIHNVVLRLRGNRRGKRLIFNGHMDTFPVGDLSGWSKNPDGEISGNKLYGLGISDMKGGIAASIYAMQGLAETGANFSGEVVCTFAGDEESMGLLGTQFLIDTVPHAIGDAMISGDAGSPNVIRFGEKGMIWARVTATGRSSHAAHVHKGESAIEKLIAVMANVAKLRDFPVDATADNVLSCIDSWSAVSEVHSGLGETEVIKHVTVTFGTFKGGYLPNLVADKAEFTADIRLPVGTTVAAVEDELKNICGTGVKLEILRRYEPNWTAPDHPIVELVRQHCQAILGVEPAVTMRVGASDARLYRYAGVPTVVCGLTPYNMGAPDEYVMLEELANLGKIFTLSAWDYLTNNID